jgi:hypothetical protein
MLNKLMPAVPQILRLGCATSQGSVAFNNNSAVAIPVTNDDIAVFLRHIILFLLITQYFIEPFNAHSFPSFMLF